jgi:hypothetical protein
MPILLKKCQATPRHPFGRNRIGTAHFFKRRGISQNPRECLMKAIVVAASAVLVLSGVDAASAQSAGPTYSDTIHQSAGDRDSRGTPKYYQGAGQAKPGRVSGRKVRSTTGSGSAGPFYEDTIHQSVGRDSRGTPKTYERPY